MTRITQRSVGEQALANLQANLTRLQAAQEQVSSGRRVNRPSDSPVDTVASMRYRDQLDRSEQYQRNISDGKGWLEAADSTLTSVNEQIGRVRQLLVAAGNAGIDANARAAMAIEVDQLREHILGLANTTHLNRPLFGGTTAQDAAYSATGTFQGNEAPVSRTVGPGMTVAVNMTGPEVFGPDASGLFAVLSQISADLHANDSAALTADLAALDGVTGTVRTAQAEVGARARLLDVAEARRAETHLGTRQNLSDAEDVDLPQAMLDLKMQELAYQSALAVTARVIQPSLVDFLR